MKNLLLLFCSFIFLLFGKTSDSIAQENAGINFTGYVKFIDEKARKVVILPDATAKLVNSKNEELKTETADKKGQFSFNLPYGEDYRILVSHKESPTAFISISASHASQSIYERSPTIYQTDILLVSKSSRSAAKYKCAFSKVQFNAKGNKIEEDRAYRQQFESGYATCETEKKTESTKTSQLTFGGRFILEDKTKAPIINTTILLVNNQEKTLYRTKTNILGAFAFNKISLAGDFRIILKDVKKELRGQSISLTTNQGKSLSSTRANSKGEFEFLFYSKTTNDLLPALEIRGEQLKKNLTGKLVINGEPAKDFRTNLLDSKGTQLQIAYTNKQGFFTFTGSKEVNILKIDLDVTFNKISSGSNIALTNIHGETLLRDKYDWENEFELQLTQEEIEKISYYYLGDPWLKLTNFSPNSKDHGAIIVTERNYFEGNSVELLENAKLHLQKIIGIMNTHPNTKLEIKVHTESRGDDTQNQLLSQKRAKAISQFLSANGISSNLLTSEGYGESSLLNDCDNNTTCSEKEHAKNQRVEFKLVFN